MRLCVAALTGIALSPISLSVRSGRNAERTEAKETTMTITAGKLFGTIGQNGQAMCGTALRSADCALDSSKYGQSMVEKKAKIRNRI